MPYISVFTRLRGSKAGHLPEVGDLSVERMTRHEFVTQTGLDPADLRGKRVLDAGCGGGRFAALLAREGVRVVGLDLDLVGLEQSRDHLGRSAGASFVQGDLFQPPFQAASFDFIYSLGVLHHTPHPPAAFAALVRVVET